jgi:hypothetical protein
MTIDPRSLAGGHATGTLAPEEKRELYRGALRDQELFDALMDEEPLRELLEDSVARQRLLAIVAEEEPQRGMLAWLASGWATAAAALLFAVALIPLAMTVLDRQRPADDSGFGVTRPTGSLTVVAPAQWAAALEGVNTDPARLSVRTTAPKDLEPLGSDRPLTLRVVPDRSGRAMVIGIGQGGEPERLYPGDGEWADVEADVPIDVRVVAAGRFAEYRLIVVEAGADVRDLPARVAEGRALVLRVRPD